MSSFLNGLFFIRRPFKGLTSILMNLQQYMFILNNTPLILNQQEITPTVGGLINAHSPTVEIAATDHVNVSESTVLAERMTDVLEVKPIVEEYITPKLNDSLFWCLYIAINGYDEYLQIQRNYGVKELEIKKSIAELVKTKANLFKLTNYKVTKVSIQEILSELLTSQKDTSMLCLIAMTIYYNINVILVNATNQLMVEFISNAESELPTYVLRKQDKQYSINIEPISQERRTIMKESMICLENYTKPLKPISNYKADDLINIAKKLGVYNDAEKLKKHDLYEKISECMKWK
jgi:hypothetical protein